MLRVPFQVDLIFNEEGSCPLCSKTFSRKSSLITHIRNHSAERKYICSYCQKRFTQAANLRNHERIHTNDRPYVCGDCGKAFTQVSILLFVWCARYFQDPEHYDHNLMIYLRRKQPITLLFLGSIVSVKYRRKSLQMNKH